MNETKRTQIKLPKGFDAYSIGTRKHERANRFTGEKIELTPVEVMIFDVVMISDYYASMYKDSFCKEAQTAYEKVRSGCGWFRQHNARAYMVLLD